MPHLLQSDKTQPNCQIVDDLPETLGILEEELALFEQHMLDILREMTQHG